MKLLVITLIITWRIMPLACANLFQVLTDWNFGKSVLVIDASGGSCVFEEEVQELFKSPVSVLKLKQPESLQRQLPGDAVFKYVVIFTGSESSAAVRTD